MRVVRWTVAAAVLALTACAAPTEATPQVRTSSAAVAAPPVSRYQFGIDLDFYWHQGQDVTSLVTAEAGYARRLGANSVLIAFPFYTNGRTAAAGAATPPVSALREAIAAVRSEGLTVGVRPLLNEANLGVSSRTRFLPGDVKAWLGSYQALIVPYARGAQEAGAARFYTGVELSKFSHAPAWQQVDAAVRTVFKGKLYFSANWATSEDTELLAGSGGPGVTVAVDAYQGMSVPVSDFTADWTAKAGALPQGTVMSEVGIAALSGAQRKPYATGSTKAPLDPQLQAAWFAAACDAVRTDHLGGIYFWSVYVGQPLNVPPTQRTPAQYTDSAGAAAIKTCFTGLEAAR